MKQFIAVILLVLSTYESLGQQQNVALNHIAFYVENLERSTTFYKEVIGLDTVPEPFKDGKHAWFKVGEGITLHLIQGPKEKLVQYRNTHTSFRINNINTFVAQLQKLGIGFEDAKGTANAVTTRPDGVKQIYFKDPDGYWVEINDDKN